MWPFLIYTASSDYVTGHSRSMYGPFLPSITRKEISRLDTSVLQNRNVSEERESLGAVYCSGLFTRSGSSINQNKTPVLQREIEIHWLCL